jgi:hypothetical protein
MGKRQGIEATKKRREINPMEMKILPLPKYDRLGGSPELVKLMDRIRFGILSESDDYAEFCWFIREYPRIYRHHFDHADFRLKSVRDFYLDYHGRAEKRLASTMNHEGLVEFLDVHKDGDNYSSYKVYWDFESFLQAASSSLDIAARIVGTAYRGDTPPNFNRFCKTAPAGKLKDIFVMAKSRWVTKMKAYRDCFTHYTPVDTLLGVGARKYKDAWEVRAKLPYNPEVREILRFKFHRRTELLRYAIQTWKNLVAFDRAIAKEIAQQYRAGNYPVKYTKLFHLGKNHSVKIDTE